MSGAKAPPPPSAAGADCLPAEAAGCGGSGEEAKKSINPELWQACAGPLVNLPVAGTHVVYFPQGHSEQVAASMKKDVDAQIPNYSNLPPKLICLLHSVTLLANPDTDEVYAQMVLRPVSSFDKEDLIRSDLSLKTNKQQTDFFCKTLTASDTSTHGGFSVPRRAAEKIFPPLDFTMQPPAQELVAKDLHDKVWTFRHIYRGQPKRHLLTTGWSLFVSGKRLFAGDSVLFIRDEKQQLLLGIRRANRQPQNLSSSVLSSDSMHIGILAAAANAAASNSIFTVFYNPRTSPSEFVIPLAKYYKAVNSYQISLGMRFRMMFETEESGTRRYMGTITGIGDVDPVRWKDSQWRNLQVGWDEANTGEKCHRVSLWDIEPVTAPFFICPPPFIRSKRPRQIGIPDDEYSDMENLFKRTMPWLHDDMFMRDPQSFPGINFSQWMNMQQNPSLVHSLQSVYKQSVPGPVLQSLVGTDPVHQFGLLAPQLTPQNNMQFGVQQQLQHLDQLQRASSNVNPCSTSQQQLGDITQQSRSLVNQLPPSSQYPERQISVQCQNVMPKQILPQDVQNQGGLPHLSTQQQILSQNPGQLSDQINQNLSNNNQAQLQMLQRFQQQQQSLHLQQSGGQQVVQVTPFQEQQRFPVDVAHNFTVPASVVSAPAAEMQQAVASPTTAFIVKPNSQQSFGTSSGLSNGYPSHIVQQMRPVQQQQQLTAMVPEFSVPAGGPHSRVNHLSTRGRTMWAGGGSSCSTSDINENYSIGPQPGDRIVQQNVLSIQKDVTASFSLSGPSVIGAASSSNNLVRCSANKSDCMPPCIDKCQNTGVFNNPLIMNDLQPQLEYLDTPNSAASVSQSQVNTALQNNVKNASSNFDQMMSQSGGAFADPGNNVSFEANTGSQNSMTLINDPLLTQEVANFGKDISTSQDLLHDLEYSKDPQQELSSSIVSQSFGVPEMTFNSIESTLSDSSFLAKHPFAPPSQQYQRMRTYTKVYKRGAVGRSIDMTAYSGYDDLKHDLARRFGIEGQLEDRNKVGWKLVYVDHENDVLLLGDDPWEEFVNCVRSIKILSPQEVQQMSLDGDVSNSVLLNQTCSSSDGGNIQQV